MTIEQRVGRLESSLRRWKLAAGVCVAALAAAVLIGAQAQQSAVPAQPNIEGFKSREIRFDESVGGRKLTPKIPATWRLVGVANGDGINANSLWFQDDGGMLHMISGFHDSRKHIFTLDGEVHSLAHQ
jgi:hypothetical protein